MKYLNLLAAAGLLLAACNSSTPKLQTNPTNPNDTISEKDKKLYLQMSNLGGNLPRSMDKPTDTMTAEEIASLQHGDILLRRGYGAVSNFIADFLEETYPVTHCGFVLKSADNKVQILHIISDLDSNGVRTESLERYLSDSQVGTLAAVRLKTSQSNREQVLREIYKLKEQNMRFDMGFNDHDDSEMYCAEMSRHVIKQVLKKDVLPDRAAKMGIDVTRMSNFFNPEYFEVVFNHLPTQ